MGNNIVIRRSYSSESDSDEYGLVDMSPPSDCDIIKGSDIYPPTAEYGDIFIVCDSAYVTSMEKNCETFYVCCKDGRIKPCNKWKWMYEWESYDAIPGRMVSRFSECAIGRTTLAKAINACCRFALNRVDDSYDEKRILTEAVEWAESNIGVKLNISTSHRNEYHRLYYYSYGLNYHKDSYLMSASRCIGHAMAVSADNHVVEEPGECITQILRGSNFNDIENDRATLARIIRNFIPLRKMLLVDVLDEVDGT